MRAYSSCKALIVGVSHYADPQYDLSYPRSDAEAVAGLLGNEFGFDQIWTLYDREATRPNIIRFFEQDLQRTDEDDGLLVFFAGHGITVTSAIGDDRGFLVPHDGDPKQPYANISLTALRDDYLPMIPAKHVLLIVDACYGGLALRDVATVKRPQTIDDAVLAELTRRDHKVRQILAAGGKDQRVLDGGLFGHSVFTGRLIEALREANPYITADHVGVHVRERVARDSLDRKHRQTPQFGYLAGSDCSFVFCRRSTHAPQQWVRNHVAPIPVQTSTGPPEPGLCPKCETAVQDQWKACPSCGTSLRSCCGYCKLVLPTGFDYCPTCSRPVSEEAVYKKLQEMYQEIIASAESALGKSRAGRRAMKRIHKEYSSSRHKNIKDMVDALADQWHATYDVLGEMCRHTDDWVDERGADCWKVMADGIRSVFEGHFLRMMQLKGPDVAASSLREQAKNFEHGLQVCAEFQKDAFRRMKVWTETRLAELDAFRKD